MTSLAEIVSTTLRAAMNRGVTYRRYGSQGQFKRAMVHRWPAEKIKGAKPYLQESIFASNTLLRRLTSV